MPYIKFLGENKYQATISAGYDELGNRKRVYKTFTAKDEDAALKKAIKLETKVEKGTLQVSTKYTFSQYVDQWKKDAERKLAPKTYLRYCELLNSRIIPYMGKVKIEKITPALLKNFYNELRKPQKREQIKKDGSKKVTVYNLSETTIRHHHRLIRSILQIAYKEGLLQENPCARVDAPIADKKDLAIYDEEQILALIKSLENEDIQYRASVHIALSGGLRLGEICGLEWKDVNYKDNSITISRTSQYLPKKGVITKCPKNETSNRTIMLPSDTMALIKELEQSQRIKAVKLGTKWQGRKFNSNSKVTGRLFTTELGAPMHPHTPSKWFHKFLKANNLPPLPFHGLRHTSASYLIACGLDVVTVAKRLGHADTNTTLKVYAHAFEKLDKSAANKMDQLFAKKKAN